jgi:hypothetical protein
MHFVVPVQRRQYLAPGKEDIKRVAKGHLKEIFSLNPKVVKSNVAQKAIITTVSAINSQVQVYL